MLITGEDELCFREAHRAGFYSLTCERLWEVEDEGLDEALAAAQGRIDIYMAERAE